MNHGLKLLSAAALALAAVPAGAQDLGSASPPR